MRTFIYRNMDSCLYSFIYELPFPEQMGLKFVGYGHLDLYRENGDEMTRAEMEEATRA